MSTKTRHAHRWRAGRVIRGHALQLMAGQATCSPMIMPTNSIAASAYSAQTGFSGFCFLMLQAASLSPLAAAMLGVSRTVPPQTMAGAGATDARSPGSSSPKTPARVYTALVCPGAPRAMPTWAPLPTSVGEPDLLAGFFLAACTVPAAEATGASAPNLLSVSPSGPMAVAGAAACIGLVRNVADTPS